MVGGALYETFTASKVQKICKDGSICDLLGVEWIPHKGGQINIRASSWIELTQPCELEW